MREAGWSGCASTLSTARHLSLSRSAGNNVMFSSVFSCALALATECLLSLASATRGVRPSERTCSARRSLSVQHHPPSTAARPTKDLSRVIAVHSRVAHITDQTHSLGEGGYHPHGTRREKCPLEPPRFQRNVHHQHRAVALFSGSHRGPSR